MKRPWTALAVSLFALGVLAGCGNTNNSVQYNTGATLVSISPSSISAGTPSSPTMCQDTTTSPRYPCFTLYVLASVSNPFSSTGTLPVVEWNGQKRPTTYVDSTDVYATIPYSYVENPGSVSVLTYQPQSGTGQNGLSNPLTFLIYGAPNPYPSLSSITPTSAAYCDSTSSKCSNVSITLTGSNFLPVSQNGGSSVTITGASTYDEETAITVNSISPTQLKATIPGASLCATGPVQVNVINPPSAICIVNCPNLGGGDTNNPPSGSRPRPSCSPSPVLRPTPAPPMFLPQLPYEKRKKLLPSAETAATLRTLPRKTAPPKFSSETPASAQRRIVNHPRAPPRQRRTVSPVMATATMPS